MRIMSSISEATCQGEWSIIGLVDGNSVDGGPFEGSLPASGLERTGTWQGLYRTGSGNHTLSFQLHVPCSVNAGQWSVRYEITDP
jgi:hypothetical protein